MLSALTISPFSFTAISIANFDFPEVVGPNKRIIFLEPIIKNRKVKFISILQLYKISDYLS